MRIHNPSFHSDVGADPALLSTCPFPDLNQRIPLDFHPIRIQSAMSNDTILDLKYYFLDLCNAVGLVTDFFLFIALLSFYLVLYFSVQLFNITSTGIFFLRIREIFSHMQMKCQG
jgi:hypothetical protein